jgi:long-subunit fatty acid transport protein
MSSKLSGLVIVVLLLVPVSALGGQQFGQRVEADTIEFFTIQDFFLSPWQLTDHNFMGGGARAAGMGGAFLAVSNDPTAASWNPAGLPQLEKSQMNLTFTSTKHRTDYTSSAVSWDYSYSDELDHDLSAVSFASVVIPFKLGEKEVVGSVLYHRLADIYQENRYHTTWDDVIVSPGDTVDNYLLPPVDEKVTGRLDEIVVSLGTKVYKSLSFGAGVNVYAGNFTSDVDYLLPLSDYGLDPSGLNGFRFHPHIESDYSGFNFTFGAMYMINELRLAGVVKTPFTLKEDNDVQLLADLLELGIVDDAVSRSISPLFDTEREWKMPSMIGFGTSYQIGSLTLAADVEFRNYSKAELTIRENLANPVGDKVTTSLGWRNTTQFRVGGEYTLDTKLGSIPLRFGFRNDPQLFKTQLDSSEVFIRVDRRYIGGMESYLPTHVQSNYGTETGSWVNGNVLSFGTGIGWSQIRFDATYEYARYDDVERMVSTSFKVFDRENRVFPETWFEDAFSSKKTYDYSRIMISFTGFF